MPLLDVFNTSAFNMLSLTVAVDKLPHRPSRVGEMNLFESRPATTQFAVVEERHGKLSLLSQGVRGGTASQNTNGERPRKMRTFPIPHVPHWDTILAADLEGKRAFGYEDRTEAEMYAEVLNDRLQAMKDDHEVTWEWHRIGALKGVVLDGDGTTEIVNFFDEFGLTETEVEFNFNDFGTYDDANPAQKLKITAQTVRRSIQSALGGTAYSGIAALCGDSFFDALIEHPSVRRAYDRWNEGEFLRSQQGYEGQSFEFAGIQWENYRGGIGDVKFIDDDECRFFPLGTTNVFIDVPAPADFVETVGTKGLPIYAKQERMKFDKGIELHTQSNRLWMCTRPKCLVKGTATAYDTGS